MLTDLDLFLFVISLTLKMYQNFIVFNEVFRGIQPQTGNYESSYLTTRPARDELPEIRF